MSLMPLSLVTLLLLAAEPDGDMYLPPSETGGGEYLFNPASKALRRAATAPAPKPDDLLDARALADDLVFFRRALRKQYVGYPELLQVPDFDVEALFDETIARLRRGPARVSFRDSALALFRALKAQINDRHFGLFGADPDPREQYREYQAPLTGQPPALDGCSAEGLQASTVRVSPVVLPGGGTGRLLTASARPAGDSLDLGCGQNRQPLRLRPEAPREPRQDELPVYEWRRAGDVGIIRIRRFQGTPEQQALLRQLAADYPKHRRMRTLVFDLRGNGGGDDGYMFAWIQQARRGIWDAGGWSVYPKGSHKPWLRWNNEVLAAIREGRVDDPAAVASREKLRSEWPRRPSDLFVRFVESRVDSPGKSPYPGRIHVLVDGRCGSSGESAAWMLRQALGALVVGERTAGYLEYGNQRNLILPRTHLVFFFSTKRNHFTTPVEAVGLPVDVYLPPALIGAPVEQLIPLLRPLPRPDLSPVR
jgi:hypothetical protein